MINFIIRSVKFDIKFWMGDFKAKWSIKKISKILNFLFGFIPFDVFSHFFLQIFEYKCFWWLFLNDISWKNGQNYWGKNIKSNESK